jgi:hypothetical protein
LAEHEVREEVSSVEYHPYLRDHAYYEAFLLNVVRLNGIRIGKDFAYSE